MSTKSIDVEYVKQLLNDMVKIDTQTSNENHQEITNYMKNVLENELQFTVEVIPYSENENKYNIIAYKKPGFKTMLCGHLDTVDIGNEKEWKTKPLECTYETKEDKTYIFGRGTSDMKGGNAVIIATIKEMIERGLNVEDIGIFFSTEEEIGVKGCKDIMKTHRNKFESVETFIILEPTDLFIGNGQNGHMWVKFTCHGKSAHGSNPFDGLNAIDGMTDLNYVLKEGIQAPEFSGNATLSIGTIEGGSQVNIVPDKCVEMVDYRFSPYIFKLDMVEMLKNIIHQMNEISYVQYEYEIISEMDALRCRDSNVILQKLNDHMKSINRHKEVLMPYGSDASVFKKEFPKSDAIIFGPGLLNTMHKSNEFIILEDIIICIEALIAVLQ